MVLKYLVSNVAGFTDHINTTQLIKLPLKYELNSTTPSSINDTFNEKLVNSGDIIHLNSIVDHVSFELLNDYKTIVLSPYLTSSTNNFDLNLRKLKISLPSKVMNSKCVSLFHNDDVLVIDLLDENYLLVSLKIKLSYFYDDFQFNLNQFSSWGSISVPYSFELRSFPFSLKLVDSLNLIVSLQDGGLLHFKRPKILSDYEVYNFNDTTSILPLNLLGGFFRKNKSENIVIEGINSNSIVDTLLISENNILTISVSKQLKIWNLKSHQSTISPINLCDNLHNSWLSTIPSKHLYQFTNSDGKSFISTYFTSIEESAFQIKTFEVLGDNDISLVSIDDNLTLESPYQIDQHNRNWFIQDFYPQFIENDIFYNVLWKSYTSSILATYQHLFGSGIKIISSSSNNHLNNLQEEFSPYHEVDYYVNKVLNSGRYSHLILRTSLDILRNHYKVESFRSPNTPIRSLIHETIQQITIDSKLVWFKLDSLCEEYRKMSQEVLSLTPIKDGKFIVLQSNGLEIYRQSHYFEELFSHDVIDHPGHKLATILNKITSSISRKTCHKLSEKVRQHGKLSLTNIDELYDTYLKSRFPDHEVEQIISELTAIPEYADLLNSFVNPVESNTSFANHFSITNSNQLSPYKKLTVIASIKDIIEQHEYILSTLLAMFLLFGGTEDNVNYINEIINHLNNYNTFLSVLGVSLESLLPLAPVESKDINHLEYSLFWSSIVDGHRELNGLIQAEKFNDVFNYIFNHSINKSDNLLVDVVIDLVNRGEGKLIQDKFFARLDKSSPTDQLLVGLVYLINDEPSQFYDTFQNNHTLFGEDQYLKNKLKLISSIDEKINDFVRVLSRRDTNTDESIAEYYHELSVLAKSRVGYNSRQQSSSTILTFGNTNHSKIESEFLHTALNFEQKSIEILKSIPSPPPSITDKIDLYYLQIFDLSLKLNNYESVYNTLSNLKSEKINDEGTYEHLFTRFIRNLISNKSISILFPPNQNELYRQNFLLIDKILLKLANTEYDLAGSRRVYEYLYSWRLFGASKSLSSDQLADKRGAIEALYLFITRFRSESKMIEYGSSAGLDDKNFELNILELYMIIMNCLKSFKNEEDRWLIKQGVQSSTLVKLNDISLEYNDWIRELKR